MSMASYMRRMLKVYSMMMIILIFTNGVNLVIFHFKKRDANFKEAVCNNILSQVDFTFCELKIYYSRFEFFESF